MDFQIIIHHSCTNCSTILSFKESEHHKMWLWTLTKEEINGFVVLLVASLVLSILARRAVLTRIITGPKVPINSLLLADQIISMIYNLVVLTAIIWTACTNIPLGKIFGSTFCWLYYQVNLFGFIYSFSGSSMIAIFRMKILIFSNHVNNQMMSNARESKRRWLANVATAFAIIISLVLLILTNAVSQRNPFSLQMCHGYNSDFLEVLYEYNMDSWHKKGYFGLIIGGTLLALTLGEVISTVKIIQVVVKHDRSVARFITALESKRRFKKSAVSGICGIYEFTINVMCIILIIMTTKHHRNSRLSFMQMEAKNGRVFTYLIHQLQSTITCLIQALTNEDSKKIFLDSVMNFKSLLQKPVPLIAPSNHGVLSTSSIPTDRIERQEGVG